MEGAFESLLLFNHYISPIISFMIDKNTVKSIVDEWIAGKEYFLVDINVSTQNEVVVEIDHKDGVWIEDCCDLSRFIEDKLNRDIEDYELEVGSAGIGQPFKITRQYINNVGKAVEVLTSDGKKMKGTLTKADEDGFTVTCQEKIKVEGSKRPKLTDVAHDFGYTDVKWVKACIDFK